MDIGKQKPVCFGHDYLESALDCELCHWSFLCYQRIYDKRIGDEDDFEDSDCLHCGRKKEDAVSLYCDHCWGQIFDKIVEEAV